MNPSPEAGQPRENASDGDKLFALFQRLLPTRFLSTVVFHLTQIETTWFKNLLMRLFLRGFTIDLKEAEFENYRNYGSFNHFFTRALKRGARPLPEDPHAFVSPVDGTVSQFGEIRDGRLVQAKGHTYSLLELLGGEAQLAAKFAGGRFCTIYLAPYNYHRIHMPVTGSLTHWSYVPGRLFSVNAATARALPNLFARNERVNAVFDTDAGPVGMAMIGALFVGSMETVWAGRITPPHLRDAPYHYAPLDRVTLGRGDEMGRFNMGSTVILLTPPGGVDWSPTLAPGQTVRMGQAIGRWYPARQNAP
ncbi:MAG TPA: archaetidylserine decarboxylase [Solimonas sp.]